MVRAVNFKTGGQTDGGSFYPQVNIDGTYVVFETEATNYESNLPKVRHIALWNYEDLEITILTSSANGDSRTPSISNDGNKMLLHLMQPTWMDSQLILMGIQMFFFTTNKSFRLFPE